MNGLIIEGIVGSGKTSLLRHILGYGVFLPRTTLVLTEHETERPLEPLSSANLRQSLELLQHWIKTISRLEVPHSPSPCSDTESQHPLFLIERFHFSHCMDIVSPDRFEEYASVESALAEFSAHIILLTIPRDHILERSIRSTSRNRGVSWRQYLQTLGANESAQAEHYRIQQEGFSELAARTRLPVTVRDTSGMEWENLAKECIEILNNKN